MLIFCFYFFAGLTVFLIGMKILCESMVFVAGDRVKEIIIKLTSNYILGFLIGAIITAILQSSSITTVIVVGLVHAGVVSFQGGIAIILGSNVGTTITGQLLSFDIEDLGLFIILLGMILYFKITNKYVSTAVVGFGMLLAGLNLITHGLSKVFYSDGIVHILRLAEGSPLLGLISGGISALLIQSSSAIIAIVIALGKEGFISLPVGLAVAFGADIGTCFTSLAASLTTNLAGKRAALSHLIFNLTSAAVILALLPFFIELVSLTSNEISRQIANGHTLYNLIGGLLFLPLISPFSEIIKRILPNKN